VNGRALVRHFRPDQFRGVCDPILARIKAPLRLKCDGIQEDRNYLQGIVRNLKAHISGDRRQREGDIRCVRAVLEQLPGQCRHPADDLAHFQRFQLLSRYVLFGDFRGHGCTIELFMTRVNSFLIIITNFLVLPKFTDLFMFINRLSVF